MQFAAPDARTRLFQVGLGCVALFVGLLAGIDPKLALVASFGLVFVLVLANDLAAGLAVFALVSFLDVLPFGGASVSFAKAVGLLLALAWMATLATRADVENDFASARPFVTYLLIVFLAWVALSSVWAEDPGNAFESVYRYALNLMLFPIVFTAVRSGRHAAWVLAAFMAGAVISAAYGVLSPPAPAPGSTGEVSRLSGAGVDPNELAALLVAATVLAGAFAAAVRSSPATRAASLGVMIFCVAGVMLSLSRGGMVALAVALLAAVAVAGRWRVTAVALLVAVASGAYVYVTAFATPAARERITNPEGGTGREDIWANAVT